MKGKLNHNFSVQHPLQNLLLLLLFVVFSACGGGGNMSSSTTSGTNVITGMMPVSSTTTPPSTISPPSMTPSPSTMPPPSMMFRLPESDPTSTFARIFPRFSIEDVAFAASKGTVQVAGTNISAFPVGGGRFLLTGVPDDNVMIHVTTPDGVTGGLSLTLPMGGGALVELGAVIVHRNGLVEFFPPVSSDLFPSALKARGLVSGLSTPVSSAPADQSCPTVLVDGLTLCFDRNTQFTPPLVTAPLSNGQNVELIAVPTGDLTSAIFRVLRIQRNSGVQASIQNTVKIVTPIIDLGAGTVTIFDGSPSTPNAHAITVDITQAKFSPPQLQNHLVKGVLVEVITGSIGTDASGKQSAVATRVKIIRVGEGEIMTGQVIELEGTISSIQKNAGTFGLSNDTVFVQVNDNITQFDDPLASSASLEVGQMVDVTAVPSKTTGRPVQALEVELEEGLPPVAVEARGTVSSLDMTKDTFVVAGITFCFNCNNVTTDFEGATLASGQFVEVQGTAIRAGVSTALTVEQEKAPTVSSTNERTGTDDKV